MVRIENDCVGCPPEMGCLGSSCPYRNVPHYYCDGCNWEDEEFYVFNAPWGNEDEIYCFDCAIKQITTEMIDAFIEEDNYYEDENIKYFYGIILNPAYNNEKFTEKQIKKILNDINDIDYKRLREDYLKKGDPKMGWEYFKNIGIELEFINYICEEMNCCL